MIVDRLYKQTHAHIHTKKERNKKNATQAHAERERERWLGGWIDSWAQSVRIFRNKPSTSTHRLLLTSYVDELTKTGVT